MDFSKFTGEDFDPKAWINESFNSLGKSEGSSDGAGANWTTRPSGSSITPAEQLAGTAIMKLQLSIQELSSSLEDSCQQMLQNIPRIVRELDAVQQESKILQDQMRLVKDDIQRVEQDTAHSMQQLLALDSVKGRVLDASSALKEADNWATLSSDVETVFESGDIQAMRTKILGMQQSLEILKDVPDFEERQALLESLRDRIEALMSPMIVAALTAESVETVQSHVEIFKDIKRVHNIIKRYQECQKTKLLQQWKEFSDSSSVTTEDKTLDRLPVLFNDILLPSWYTQLKWCGIVFGSAESSQIAIQVIVASLHDLVPSMSSVLTQIVKENAGEPLTALIQSRRFSEGFCQRLLTDLGSGYSSSSSSSDLVLAIFEPYFSHVASFGDYIQRHLLKELESIPLSHADDVDAARLLADSIARVVALATQGMEFCSLFTNGVELPALQTSIVNMMKEYAKDFKRVLVNMKARHAVKGKSDAILDVEWDHFQQALRIVHITGELIIQMEELDSDLATSAASQLVKLDLDSEPKMDGPSDRLIATLRRSWRTRNNKNPTNARLLPLLELRDSLTESSSFLGESSLNSLRCLAKTAQEIAFDFVFQPLKAYLGAKMRLEGEETVSGEQLPTFAESEYVTEVGQYLMTVPQQLEPFVGTSSEDAAMRTAVQWGQLDAANLNLSASSSSNHELSNSSSDFDLASYWLDAIARAFADIYVNSILNIPRLTSKTKGQLSLDLEYLHVVFEDLGVSAKEEVGMVLELLKVEGEGAAEKFVEVGDRVGAGKELMRRIGALKGIKLDVG